MDEFLYLLALAVGIVGGGLIWWYSKAKKRAVTQAIKKQEGNEQRE
jgi:hypothetical protein